MRIGQRMTRLSLLCAASALLAAALSGCAGGPRTELVVIPDGSEAPASGTGTRPFQVKTIYRLPAAESSVVQPLGWAGPDTVVALSVNLRPRDELIYRVQSFAPPYTNSATLLNVDAGTSPESLSPDSRYLSGTSRTEDGIAVKLVSLTNGEERTVATLAAGGAKLISEAGAWSANSRYLAYLLLAVAPQQEARADDTGNGRAGAARPEDEPIRSIGVLLVDALNGSAEQYLLTGLDDVARGVKVLPSDDAGALLIVSDSTVRMAEKDGDGYAVKFSPPASRDKIEGAADWVDDDRFVYPDENGTLYAYDRRIAETVILLEKTGSYRLSRDRKAIAYFASGQDAVYAGKLQGNNILQEQLVYQGIVPAFMDWSPDGNRLLIEGRKRFAPSGQIARPAPTTVPAEQQQLAEISAAEEQQLIVVFE